MSIKPHHTVHHKSDDLLHPIRRQENDFFGWLGESSNKISTGVISLVNSKISTDSFWQISDKISHHAHVWKSKDDISNKSFWQANDKTPVSKKLYLGTKRPLGLKSSNIEFIEVEDLNKSVVTEILVEQKPRRLVIEAKGKEVDTLNSIFTSLYESINSSKYILDLDDNWDDENSKGFEFETWKSAVKFLVTYFNAAYDLFGKEIAPPSIFPSSDGSIDLLWKKENYRLLINVPEESSVVTFYGDDRKNTSIQGSCDLSLETHKGLILTLLDCS